MNIVIIEDERPLAKDLAKTIAEVIPDALICAQLPSVEEAIEFFKTEHKIDVIFSDIQLGDGLSFDIFAAINNKVPIIFCTAFNNYMLEAFETMGIDYIIKPVNKDSITKALKKYTLLTGADNQVLDFKKLLSGLSESLKPLAMPSVILHQGEKIIPLSGKEIAFFLIENLMVYAFSFEGRKWPVNQNLDTLEKKFAPFFYRANRQYLINRKAVKSAAHYPNRKIRITLNSDFPDAILVGKEKVTDFLEWLSNG
ncbi:MULTISPECIES: LytR/AlgR family response regulator transcription factor [Flavobacterium]|uniref:LytR/AlgR family response regulator transcription factor n=1 Tax=Flavobacterium TaxID=237 RepID=UPI002114D508|nr:MULTISPECIES: LytTR family DNA-binding domain-containing protein [Flavobacterium]UUF12489.1 LytTR family DNA-binding domain-containing protein [Flavobacterium panici]